MCDSHLRFIYAAAAAPGHTNDDRVFCKLELLNKWLDELEREFFVIGNNTYTLKDSLQIPFSGSEKQSDNFNRAFCFWLSQLRICIEMAFGLLTTKWRIFRSNLLFATDRNSQIIQVAMKLHNYVINYDKLKLERDMGMEFDNLERFGVKPLADGPGGNHGFLPLEESLSEREKEAYRKCMKDGGVTMKENDGEEVGVSDPRDLILEQLRERGMDRPL